MPSSCSDDKEVSESIIVDTNGGEVIVIDSTDDEMDLDDGKSRQTPCRRVQRKRVSPQSREMIDWMSREYETISVASLAAVWKMVWKQWGKVRTESDRQLAQILDRFHEKMSNIQRYELWNEKYRRHDGRRAYRAWERYGIEKRTWQQAQTKKVKRLVRQLGGVLRRLQEVEEEHLSIAAPMNDGDSKDCDYMPAPTRRLRKKKS